MPIFWDTRMAQAKLKQRLSEMSFPKVAIYAIGCVTHSRDTVLAYRPSPLHTTFQKMSDLLDDFWQDYPNSLDNTATVALYNNASKLLPDEEQAVGYEFAEDILMEGIVYAFSLATKNVYSEEAEMLATGAIDRGYIFVYTFHHELDQIYKTEEAIRAVESSSQHCLDEIAFQLDFLSRIEAAQGLPPPYTEIIQEMGE